MMQTYINFEEYSTLLMYYRIEAEFTGTLEPKTKNPQPLPSDWSAIQTCARICDDLRVMLRMLDYTYAVDGTDEAIVDFCFEVHLPAKPDGEKLIVAIPPHPANGDSKQVAALGFFLRPGRWLVAYFTEPVQLSANNWVRLLFYPPDSNLSAGRPSVLRTTAEGLSQL